MRRWLIVLGAAAAAAVVSPLVFSRQPARAADINLERCQVDALEAQAKALERIERHLEKMADRCR